MTTVSPAAFVVSPLVVLAYNVFIAQKKLKKIFVQIFSLNLDTQAYSKLNRQCVFIHFMIVSCLGKQLSSKPFYSVSERIYCEDDFLVSICFSTAV